MKEAVKLNHLPTPFQADFSSLPQSVGKNSCTLV